MDLLKIIMVIPPPVNSGIGMVLGYWLIMIFGYLTGMKTYLKACKDYHNKTVTSREWDSVEYVFGEEKLKYLIKYRFLNGSNFISFIGYCMYSKSGLIVFLATTFLIAIYLASWYFKF